jgi:hypothetical protein
MTGVDAVRRAFNPLPQHRLNLSGPYLFFAPQGHGEFREHTGLQFLCAGCILIIVGFLRHGNLDRVPCLILLYHSQFRTLRRQHIFFLRPFQIALDSKNWLIVCHPVDRDVGVKRCQAVILT